MNRETRSRTQRWILAAACAAWLPLVALGLVRLWGYAHTAGAAAWAPKGWPEKSNIVHNRELPHLVLFAHPHCPCSQATVAELEMLMTRRQGLLTTTVVMLRPEGMPETWEHTDLCRRAAAIPGVIVVADRAGIESRRFGAATSGQALLYSSSGELLFSGGITASRGHSGDNVGRSAIEALLDGSSPTGAAPVTTAVYGCPLFDAAAECQDEGVEPCHN